MRPLVLRLLLEAASCAGRPGRETAVAHLYLSSYPAAELPGPAILYSTTPSLDSPIRRVWYAKARGRLALYFRLSQFVFIISFCHLAILL